MRRIGRRLVVISALSMLAGIGWPAYESLAVTTPLRSAPAIAPFSCDPGSVPLYPISSSVLADGGLKYEYEAAGATLQYVVPPTDFNPLTASVATLSAYGFPSPPANANGRADWTNAMSGYRSVPLPHLCQGVATDDGPPMMMTPIATADIPPPVGGQWGGRLAQAGGTRFDMVELSWTQMSFHDCQCTPPDGVSTWAGLGGYNINQLLQAGTVMHEGSTPAGNWKKAFFEYIGSGTSCQKNPPIYVGNVYAGDLIYTQTSYQTSSNTANFYVSADGIAFPISSKNLAGCYYDGSTAEWINEFPGGSTHLTNYGHTDFTRARAYTNDDASWHNAEALAASRINLAGDYGLLETVGTQYGAQFSMTWVSAN